MSAEQIIDRGTSRIDGECLNTELYSRHRAKEDDPSIGEEGVHQGITDLHREQLDKGESHSATEQSFDHNGQQIERVDCECEHSKQRESAIERIAQLNKECVQESEGWLEQEHLLNDLDIPSDGQNDGKDTEEEFSKVEERITALQLVRHVQHLMILLQVEQVLLKLLE